MVAILFWVDNRKLQIDTYTTFIYLNTTKYYRNSCIIVTVNKI